MERLPYIQTYPGLGRVSVREKLYTCTFFFFAVSSVRLTKSRYIMRRIYFCIFFSCILLKIVEVNHIPKFARSAS